MSHNEIVRIRLALSETEYAALQKACARSLRTPDAEVRYLLRSELQKLGLLASKEVKKDEIQ